ncbi:hypothetical protein P9E34_14210 [Schinkia azotoformans]|uniref:hypothetical protein n=1 Tax=Schinkia azotoformans TaxID=1454 RepID=UPI002DBE4B01|nr:hypothetical protein [Schinkia azotoformans]MEC1725868.1 hypothetical protein [Schinkia azotoformans]
MEEDKYKDYSTEYINSNDIETDSKELDRVIKVHSEQGYILHSVIPKVCEGDTQGYILIFDCTNVD